MSAPFTKGPWYILEDGNRCLVRRESDDAVIATAEDGCHCDPNIELIGDDEREANARLIAAAPDLYEALADMLRAYGNEAEEVAAHRKAEAALAKVQP